MSVEQRPRTAADPPTAAADLRASDRERDDVLVRLHTAYAEGRLTEGELDERIDLALAARTHRDLGRLSADLPAAPDEASARECPGDRPAVSLAGRFQLAYKSRVRRSGRWLLPTSFTSVVYKGGSLLDLRCAELGGPVTSIRVLAYKSTVEILVPPGVRVEFGGLGVSGDLRGQAPPGAPVLRVTGIAYKGAIEMKDHIHRP